MKSRVIIVAAVVFILLSMACERQKNGLGPNDDPNAPQDIVYTHQDSVEAYDLALWMTGDLAVPQEWVSKVMYDLYYLRYKFSGPYWSVKERFMTPWHTGVIICEVDSLSAVQICNHEYTYWQQLPAEIRPDSIQSYPKTDATIYRYMIVAFPQRYHPKQVAQYYEQLPGLSSCSHSPRVFAHIFGAGFNFFPRLHDNGDISWLFIVGGAVDIPDFLYFKTIDNKPEFIGGWEGNVSVESQPGWLQEALKNQDEFYK